MRILELLRDLIRSICIKPSSVQNLSHLKSYYAGLVNIRWSLRSKIDLFNISWKIVGIYLSFQLLCAGSPLILIKSYADSGVEWRHILRYSPIPLPRLHGIYHTKRGGAFSMHLLTLEYSSSYCYRYHLHVLSVNNCGSTAWATWIQTSCIYRTNYNTKSTVPIAERLPVAGSGPCRS